MALITFADLTHTGKIVDANQFPLAIGFVAAVAKSRLQNGIDAQLFKFPTEFAEFLENHEPQVACFSNYMWHERLNHEFATRIKKRYPRVITVFGGPNFPTESDEQLAFLKGHPEIDFYIDGEGEVPFFELFKELSRLNFDVDSFKKDRPRLSNLRYLAGDEFVAYPLAPRLKDIEGTIPSPYLMGLFDKFFVETLSPLMETARGCPYSCTFCHSGIAYENKVARFAQNRIQAELNYIVDRVKVPSLLLADLNWGMFKEDLITARQLADLRRTRGWPRFVHHSTAKNQRDRMVEISSILGDAIVIGATVQSTDPDVLNKIKRSNIAIEKSIAMAKASSRNGSNTFTEIILCLPGDTYDKHINSVLTMMDAGMDDAAIYQFILLPGTEAGDRKSREEYKYDTRFRVMPRCFGTYPLFGEEISVFEYHEVCVGNSTIPYEDYKRCRSFSLTISIFNNGNIFEEIFGLAQSHGIKKSRIIIRIHDMAIIALADIYERFHKDEERNFFSSREEIEQFLSADTAVEAYSDGRYGANQIYVYRALSLTERIEEITEIAVRALQEELVALGSYDKLMEMYLVELREFIILRKSNPFDVEGAYPFWSHFDFGKIESKRFSVIPSEYYIGRTEFDVRHGKDKIIDLKKYFSQYGSNLDGLTYFMHRHPARMMYRLAIPAGRATESDSD